MMAHSYYLVESFYLAYTVNMVMHHIQRNILNKLAEYSSLRYGELKPKELDGNVFGYHLKRLIADTYVNQDEEGAYRLAAKGRDFIVHRYEKSTHAAHTIYLIVIKNGSSYLMRTRKVQPLLGWAGFIHGEPTPETDVISSAKERLLSKTGLSLELNIIGTALITQIMDDELQSFSHAIILYGETDMIDIADGDSTGINKWSTLDTTHSLLPSCHDIITMIEEGKTWLEKTYYL